LLSATKNTIDNSSRKQESTQVRREAAVDTDHLKVIGRRSIFVVEKQSEVSQWNVTTAFKARFRVNRTLPR